MKYYSPVSYTHLDVYKRQLYNNSKWVLLNPTRSLDLDTLATFPADTYVVWFTVTDLRSGLQVSTTFDVKVASTIYEGWMILCDEGDEERVRMDMVSVISADRIVPAYDLLTSLGRCV